MEIFVLQWKYVCKMNGLIVCAISMDHLTIKLVARN